MEHRHLVRDVGRRKPAMRCLPGGASLIEVLIAVLILGVGLLASSVMQVSSLQANQDSHFSAQAGSLLEGMVDRMRGNPEGLIGGFYDAADTDAVGESTSDCRASPCTAEQLALADIAMWRTLLAPDDGSLPALPPRADGSPARVTVAEADGVYTASVTWMTSQDGESTDTTLATRFRP